ncbi:CAP domain-containing protein [Halobacillus sp. ACCC02827]|uniref:CAP domain-containing protein n=1 Tax=Halobacillus sp. ACCC02827 TaxID=3052090 RepID=UPI00256FEDE3|nr:CAP domain-containing protein [Halobacillus sp. ACCC02827]WJE15594.1 CAP domain-containing protein [Halobacillus sp. ACCC02827]
MPKHLWYTAFAVMMLIMLAACNTTDQSARERQQNNLNEVSFDPADRGTQDRGSYGQYENGQNRFDANIPFEGMNPNGTAQDPYLFEQKDGQDQSAAPEGDFQQKVLDLTNEAREKQGLQPLKNSNEVEEVAQDKSEDMAENNYFSHTSPKYGSPFEMLKEYGVDYRKASENIAAGQSTPDEVVKGWLNSPGHRKNIMDKNMTHVGVGFSEDGNQWVQMFIRK